MHFEAIHLLLLLLSSLSLFFYYSIPSFISFVFFYLLFYLSFLSSRNIMIIHFITIIIIIIFIMTPQLFFTSFVFLFFLQSYLKFSPPVMSWSSISLTCILVTRLVGHQGSRHRHSLWHSSTPLWHSCTPLDTPALPLTLQDPRHPPPYQALLTHHLMHTTTLIPPRGRDIASGSGVRSMFSRKVNGRIVLRG